MYRSSRVASDQRRVSDVGEGREFAHQTFVTLSLITFNLRTALEQQGDSYTMSRRDEVVDVRHTPPPPRSLNPH